MKYCIYSVKFNNSLHFLTKELSFIDKVRRIYFFNSKKEAIETINFINNQWIEVRNHISPWEFQICTKKEIENLLLMEDVMK